MKKILGIAFVIIFFLGILGLILFNVLRPKPEPIKDQTSQLPGSNYSTVVQVSHSKSPAEVAVAFYNWYLVAYTKNESANELATHLQDWLTPGFLSNLPNIKSQTDGDPFFLAQDSPPLDSVITSSITSQTEAGSSVKVLFQSTAGSVTYLVNLKKLNGDWRIDSISLAP